MNRQVNDRVCERARGDVLVRHVHFVPNNVCTDVGACLCVCVCAYAYVLFVVCVCVFVLLHGELKFYVP